MKISIRMTIKYKDLITTIKIITITIKWNNNHNIYKDNHKITINKINY